MTDSLHPTEGARFLFELVDASGSDAAEGVGGDAADDASGDADSGDADSGGDAVSYRAAIFTPDERIDYDCAMAIDGSYELRARGESANAELTKKLDTLAKLIARGASRKQRDGLPPWPHRVLRWRGPGRG